MRSGRGLSTIQHCLQWYKLVLRAHLSTAAVKHLVHKLIITSSWSQGLFLYRLNPWQSSSGTKWYFCPDVLRVPGHFFPAATESRSLRNHTHTHNDASCADAIRLGVWPNYKANDTWIRRQMWPPSWFIFHNRTPRRAPAHAINWSGRRGVARRFVSYRRRKWIASNAINFSTVCQRGCRAAAARQLNHLARSVTNQHVTWWSNLSLNLYENVRQLQFYVNNTGIRRAALGWDCC